MKQAHVDGLHALAARELILEREFMSLKTYLRISFVLYRRTPALSEEQEQCFRKEI